MIEVTIIIPTYNRTAVLLRTLQALNNQVLYNMETIEVLVVDDCSPDSPEQELRVLEPDLRFALRYLRMEKNSGQGMARNKGIKEAHGKYLFFLGDDIIPEENLIYEHMKLHKKFPGIAVLGNVTWADEVRNEFMDFVEKIQFHYHTIKDPLDVKLHFYTSNISLEKKWFNNEEYNFKFKNYGFEDIELGYRLEKKGLRVVYNSNALAHHVHSYEFKQFCKRMYNVGKTAIVFTLLHPELKRKYIPYGWKFIKIICCLLFPTKLFAKKIYWYTSFVYYYFKGVEEQKNVEGV